MPKCKYCKSKSTIGWGYRYNKSGKKHRWKCKDCNRTFVIDDGFLCRKYPKKIIVKAIDLYHSGLSFNGVSNYIYRNHGFEPANSTIWRWAKDYAWVVKKVDKEFKFKPSNMYADEIVLKILGVTHWFWSTFDEKSRFCISNIFSMVRNENSKVLFKMAKEKMLGYPKKVFTDGLWVYLDAFNKYFLYKSKYVRASSFKEKSILNLMERFNGTIKDRHKVKRGLKDLAASWSIQVGFILHYNYVRNHLSLGMTPAEAAGFSINLGRNKWLGLIRLAARLS